MVQRHRHSGGYILGHGGYILAHYIPVYGDHIMVQKCDRQVMEVICRSSKVIFGVAWLYSEDGGYSLGKDGVSKIDVFSEKFQTAFDPPPHFWKIMLRISGHNCDKSAYVHYGGTVVYYLILFPMRCM